MAPARRWWLLVESFLLCRCFDAQISSFICLLALVSLTRREQCVATAAGDVERKPDLQLRAAAYARASIGPSRKVGCFTLVSLQAMKMCSAAEPQLKWQTRVLARTSLGD
jgi:hypothetical protein